VGSPGYHEVLLASTSDCRLPTRPLLRCRACRSIYMLDRPVPHCGIRARRGDLSLGAPDSREGVL
jgi:hypothetical protein